MNMGLCNHRYWHGTIDGTVVSELAGLVVAPAHDAAYACSIVPKQTSTLLPIRAPIQSRLELDRVRSTRVSSALNRCVKICVLRV